LKEYAEEGENDIYELKGKINKGDGFIMRNMKAVGKGMKKFLPYL